MSQDAFDLDSKTDMQIVAAYRRSGRPALHDVSGASLVLHCVYRGREAAASALVAAGHRSGVHESAAMGDVIRLRQFSETAPCTIDLLSPDGWTPLHLAAFFGRTSAVQYLVARGADARIWSRSFERNLPIHAAAAGRSTDLALIEALTPVSDVDAVQDEGYSALLIAASNGKKDWIEALAKAGADPDRRTKDGKRAADLLPRA